MLSRTTMRLLDKVPIRRVSDRAGQGGHTSDIETSNTTKDYPNFKPHSSCCNLIHLLQNDLHRWYTLNCLLLLFVILCCNVYYCWQVRCIVILACSKSFSETHGDRNTQTCNGKHTQELFQGKWFLTWFLWEMNFENKR